MRKSILEAIKKDEKLMRGYENAVMRSAVRYRREVRKSMQGALEDLLTDNQGYVISSPMNSTILNFSTQEMNRILGSGFAEMVDETQKIYQKRLRTINRLAVNLGVEEAVLTDVLTNPRIQERIADVFTKVAKGKVEIAKELQKKVLEFRQGIGSGKLRRKEIIDTMVGKAGIAPTYAATKFRTELAGVDREARIMQAEQAEIDDFRYTGVKDNLTRPFCDRHIGKVEPKEYWENADNGQINPPMIYGGGYNCRHRLIMWKPEWDNEELTVKEKLEKGKIKEVKNLGGGINDTKVITYADGRKAVFKPVVGENWGERPAPFVTDIVPIRETIKNREFTLAQREVMASEMSDELGWDLVPKTVFREIDGKLGSVQDWAEDAILYDGATTVTLSKIDYMEMYRATAFDKIIGNTDRHTMNMMVSEKTGKLHAIDNGYSFPINTAEKRLDVQRHFVRDYFYKVGTVDDLEEFILQNNPDEVFDMISDIENLDLEKIAKKYKMNAPELRNLNLRRDKVLRELNRGRLFSDI